MSPILDALEGLPVLETPTGVVVFSEGETTGRLWVLVEGAVEVVKGGVTVTRVSESGAVFGDLSALLDIPHTAAVHTVAPSRFFVIDHPRAFLERHPEVTLHLCQLLARRLDGVNKYLVDLKRQFDGHDHLGMVDGMLDLLMHRQPRPRIAPPRSTLRDPEVSE